MSVGASRLPADQSTSLPALRARETTNNGSDRLPTSHLFERLICNSRNVVLIAFVV
ncbi:hypothetical protein J6590_021236 [Homalodisca vitripennis]|nr:hypothetical protein J6590_021236 [Homalodisca vitripennis]